MDQKSSEFIVKLNGIKLPDKVEQQMADEIGSLVMREMAKTDFKGDLVVRNPIEWRGRYLEKIDKGRIPFLRVNESQ
jgi:hypothetical protein